MLTDSRLEEEYPEIYNKEDYVGMGKEDDPENDWEYSCVNCGCDTRTNPKHDCSNS